MGHLVGCWDPLASASHCVTTSWLAAAIQTIARIIPVFPVFYAGCPSCFNTLCFLAWDRQRIRCLAYLFNKFNTYIEELVREAMEKTQEGIKVVAARFADDQAMV